MNTTKLYEFNVICKKNEEYQAIDIVCNSSDASYQILKRIFDKVSINIKEYFFALYVSNSNQIIGYSMLSMGGMAGTVVDIRILFREAILANATAIIIAHNHPSGKLTPSEADKKLTQKIKDASLFLDIKLLDHLIISEYGYFSFLDEAFL
ncbi:JAB domain-containing protein (plasmid) [Myroides albus]|uniref:MPN domain-containing protein n=1 Tax=Myroides odoratimimus TaxID=76832 RepID=A0AAI8C9H5_9FLAO|nr:MULTISPECIES: JAB domain-containing protein [Myroides]ALU28447.1 hypothetical protein AS202_19900 [Myroides odoratimimus]UVD81365.1 JAB domain-containing protein [Myroides albus]UVD81383.1 JAB domain-containing protein [Myroides albus]